MTLGAHTRLVLTKHPVWSATVNIHVQHTGQCIGWTGVRELAAHLRSLGAYVKLPEGYER